MENYNLIKALHIISIIAWMAGLLYLPRLYVYHSEKSGELILNETFKTMERRLMVFIMNPAMISSFIWHMDDRACTRFARRGMDAIKNIPFGRLDRVPRGTC